MEWLLILALAFWVWRQGRRIEALSKQVQALEARPLVAPAPETAPAAEEDVLLLDTPLPDASNDEIEADVLVLREPAPPRPEDVLVLTQALAPDDAAPARARRRTLEQWLAERGLAWMGGGAFALGGIMLVAIAVQQSWFTPAVRLICALVLGASLIAASEWLRRRPNANALVAALLAGAGVAIFYATAWGAFALYHYISAGAAAAALAICALLLFALSFRHGQALGVLAVLTACLAPALTNSGSWPSVSLDLYLVVAAAAGFAITAARRWAWTGAAALLGLYFWFAAAIGADDNSRALITAALAAIGGAALSLRKPIPGASGRARLDWRRAHALAPSIAICLSSVALIWTWLIAANAQSGAVFGPALAGAMFVALAAAAVRARAAPAAIVAVAVAALAFGFMAYLGARFYPLPAQFYPFILLCAGAVIVAALAARPHRRDRALVAIAGAAGAALLTMLGAFSAPAWGEAMAYAPLFIGAGALFAAAWAQARDVLNPHANLAVDAWAGAGAVLVLLGVESLFSAEIRAAAHAGAALGLAAGFGARGWRGLAWGALAAATMSLAHAFAGETGGAALSLAAPITRTLGVLVIAAGLLFVGARLCTRRAQPSPTGEALAAAGLMLALLATFFGLRWIAAGGAGAPLDSFTEAAMRALALMGAGHIALPRAAQPVWRIGALRGHVLIALGFAYLVLSNGLTFNPWWGVEPGFIGGAPLLNALALSFAAPAALLLWAARRLYTHRRAPARLYAGAGAALTLAWALLELRRAFHGANMAGASVGAVEGACYGLLFILAAVIVALLARVRQGVVGADMRAIRAGATWAGLCIGAWLLLLAQSGWWAGGAPNALTGLWLTLSLIAACMLALVLGRLLSTAPGVEPSRFAAAAAACVFAWGAGHGLIGWAAPGAAMLHALWPLALCVLGAAVTARAPGRDTIRHYLYDLQAIWANAAWPSMGVGALGLWLVVNPWWGALPAASAHWPASLGAIALIAAAAPLSLRAQRIPHLRKADWFGPAARAVAAGHLFVAATLIVRAAFHDGALAPGGAGGAELWTYSALWALFGAGALAYGALRVDAVLRWCGLAILFATAAKVFAFDTARLSGIIRVASLLGLAAIATLTALAMRRMRAS